MVADKDRSRRAPPSVAQEQQITQASSAKLVIALQHYNGFQHADHIWLSA
jgi:hypothetical protein